MVQVTSPYTHGYILAVTYLQLHLLRLHAPIFLALQLQVEWVSPKKGSLKQNSFFTGKNQSTRAKKMADLAETREMLPNIRVPPGTSEDIEQEGVQSPPYAPESPQEPLYLGRGNETPAYGGPTSPLPGPAYSTTSPAYTPGSPPPPPAHGGVEEGGQTPAYSGEPQVYATSGEYSPAYCPDSPVRGTDTVSVAYAPCTPPARGDEEGEEGEGEGEGEGGQTPAYGGPTSPVPGPAYSTTSPAYTPGSPPAAAAPGDEGEDQEQDQEEEEEEDEESKDEEQSRKRHAGSTPPPTLYVEPYHGPTSTVVALYNSGDLAYNPYDMADSSHCTSPAYNPYGPTYSSVNTMPAYSPTSPVYGSVSPAYNPHGPAYSPTSPTYSSVPLEQTNEEANSTSTSTIRVSVKRERFTY